MPKGMLLRLGAIFALAVVSHRAADSSRGTVDIQKDKDRLHITVNGEPFADYVFAGFSRPFLFPIHGPGGAKMTRNYPLAPGENEEHDHIHHKSFWWGHGDMNGVDFWAEEKKAGKVEHVEFTSVESGKVGVIRSRNKYVDQQGKVICTDDRTIRIYPETSARMFDFEITVHASNGDLKFGDTKEGTMAMRLAETMRLKGKVGKGHIVNSEGVRDDQTWGKRASWVDYYGPVDGKTVGVAIFDHPSNPRHPTWWHVRDYGLFAANPFGLHDFEKKPVGAGDMTVASGQSITFKYRFYIHSGDDKEGRVREVWDKYKNEKGEFLYDKLETNPLPSKKQ
jgi:hypothetical protein